MKLSTHLIIIALLSLALGIACQPLDFGRFIIVLAIFIVQRNLPIPEEK
jgi:hypothetical protein